MQSAPRLVWFRRLALAGTFLAFCVVVLGAWVRLTDAGLGCPDWPGCYGHAFPSASTVDFARAVHEMVHRYIASSLGLIIAALSLLALVNRRDPDQPVAPAAALFGLVCLQGLLGMETVTLKLEPLIVTAHLLGGLTTLGVLRWLSLERERRAASATEQALRPFALAAFTVLALQIFLGGWTSTHYAAVACPDLPTCQRSFWPAMDFKDAFVPWRGRGIDYEGGVLAHPARVAIHVTHRLGAVVAGLTLLGLGVAVTARARGRLRIIGGVLILAVLAQISLGLSTVHWGVPLSIATLHNAGAAFLVLVMVTLLRALWPETPAAAVRGEEWRDYLELTKPKVSLLIVFTAIVGMVLASPGMVPLPALVFGTLGIALASGSAAAFNHVLDRRIDEQMARTRRRPLPAGHLSKSHAVTFASILGAGSMLVLWPTVGGLTALLTFVSLIGYAVVYTLWLKRATPQNIVIGGAAGAAPPVLGWAAVTHTIDAHALLLFLIIFTWTPPHFWALAIARRDDYAKAGIPMMPVTHGIPFTRLQIVLYTILLGLCTLLPVLTRMSGVIYLLAAIPLNARFLHFVLKLNRDRGERPQLPMQTFRFSITYLLLLFAALIVDHYALIAI